MASVNKKNKAKNSGGWRGILKDKGTKLKRRLFYTSSQRKSDKLI